LNNLININEIFNKKIRKDFTKIIPILFFIILIFPRLIGISIPIKELELSGSIFHFGESFAAATSIWNNSENIPITIHGGMDFFPAILSRLIFGSENYYYPTIYFTYCLIPIITYSIFLLFINKIYDKKHSFISSIFLCIAAVSTQYLFSIREFFLILTLFSLYKYLFEKDEKSYLSRDIFLIFFTSFGLLWSFDRGLAGFLTVVTTLLFRALLSKKTRDLKITVIIIFTSLSLIHAAQFLGLLSYFENISFLFQTSSQWNYQWKIKTTLAAILLSLFVIFSILITGRAFFLKRNADYKSYWIGMSFCSLIMLRIAINRIDLGHMFFAMWVPMINTAFLCNSKEIKSINKKDKIETLTFALISSSIFFFISKGGIIYGFLLTGFSSLMIWINSFSRLKRIKFITLNIATFFLIFLMLFNLKQYGYIASGNFKKLNIVTPIEFLNKGVNYSEVFPDTLWVSNQIKKSNSKCLLDMTNTGTINAGVDLPSCLTFSYPVYATDKFEEQLLNDVKKKNINKIVYSTSFWHYAIDGKDMKSRFPKLDSFLIKEFPIQKCEQNFCIRSKSIMD
jgi:hypothetical protein